ncbi:octanoyltransferase [Mergibacter septicus]|uniref:lipoyl(octanoyl) transferase LipB n=1 Tax=Mergibacter septicus TaxID=221402 RepID=UPI001C793A2B|nr:lipoyl(octanoyl) transferase LipB [Mergibacter septicus]QDJ13162.1 octanoyltransferase [Mergibacter septicus]
MKTDLPTSEQLYHQLYIRQLGEQPYETIWHLMQTFTDQRDDNSFDEIWLVEHPAVFTQGTAGKAEHLLQQTTIPVVQSDRGGQITYHGPGQQVMYVLIDLKRRKRLRDSNQPREFSVRELVSALEQCVITTLAEYGLESYAKPDAPGVYIQHKKICSLGLRVRKGRSFHGLALNIKMDLTPFRSINPCGYAGLEMCQLQDLVTVPVSCKQVAEKLVKHFAQQLDYSEYHYINTLPILS